MPIVITRKHLYERVWVEPIQKLSKEYGLSDVGSRSFAVAMTSQYLLVGTGQRS
jgi:hypothetical protein